MLRKVWSCVCFFFVVVYGVVTFVSSYILYNSIVQTDKDMDLHSKTTLFKDTITTETENRGKGNQKGKED